MIAEVMALVCGDLSLPSAVSLAQLAQWKVAVVDRNKKQLLLAWVGVQGILVFNRGRASDGKPLLRQETQGVSLVGLLIDLKSLSSKISLTHYDGFSNLD